MGATFAFMVDEGAEEEAGHWGAGGEKNAVVLNPGIVS